MKRIALAAAAVALVGGAFAVPASADPSVCVSADVNIAGTQLPVPAETCLPPAE